MGYLSYFSITILSCKKDDNENSRPIITLKAGGQYTPNLQEIPAGGKLKFGIKVTSGDDIITNPRIQRIADGKLLTEKDQELMYDQGNKESGAFKVFPSCDFFSNRAVKALTEARFEKI